MKIKLILIFSLCLACVSAFAGDDDFCIWTSFDVRTKVVGKLDAVGELEFRTQDGFGDVERLAGTLGLSYKPFSYLKADLGYSYIHRHVLSETTQKGNIVDDYWSPRHRIFVSLTGSYKWNRLKFSLRERYQFTQRTATSAAKYDGDDGSRKDDEEILAKSKNVLRSRLQIEWDIRNCSFTPYVSCELFNSLDEDCKLEKTRISVGTEYKFNKKNALDVFYRYQNQSDDDEPNGHVVGVGYSFRF